MTAPRTAATTQQPVAVVSVATNPANLAYGTAVIQLHKPNIPLNPIQRIRTAIRTIVDTDSMQQADRRGIVILIRIIEGTRLMRSAAILKVTVKTQLYYRFQFLSLYFIVFFY